MPDMCSKMAEKLVKRKYKPSVSIGVSVNETYPTPTSGGSNWRKEEMERIGAEVKALEEEISNFDAKEAAEKVKRSLDIKLKLKKLRLEEIKLKMDAGDSY